MASTNKTPNYDLSQFTGTDKPAWLQDYNSDMSKIDTGIKTASDNATAANGKADTANTNIGDMSYLATTNKNTLVAAINEVKSDASTAQNTANQAAQLATESQSISRQIAAYFSITKKEKITPTISGGTVGSIDDVYYALNEDGTLGKIYGKYRLTTTTGTNVKVTLPVPALNVTEEFTIASAGYFTKLNVGSGTWGQFSSVDFIVKTNGTIEINLGTFNVGDTITLWFPPCLYFFTDFGDIYNPPTP